MLCDLCRDRKLTNCDGGVGKVCTNCVQDHDKNCTYYWSSLGKQTGIDEAEQEEILQKSYAVREQTKNRCHPCKDGNHACNLLYPCNKCVLHGRKCEYTSLLDIQHDKRHYCLCRISCNSPEGARIEGFTTSEHIIAAIQQSNSRFTADGNSWVIGKKQIVNAQGLLEMVEQHGQLVPRKGTERWGFSNSEKHHTSQACKHTKCGSVWL